MEPATDPFVAWAALAVLGVLTLWPFFVVELRLRVNARKLVDVWLRLLRDGEMEKVERLLRAFGTKPSVPIVMQAMWEARHRAADVGTLPSAGYRERIEVEPYAVRLQREIAPVVAGERQRWRRQLYLALIGVLAPLPLVFLPGVTTAMWIVAAVIVAMAAKTVFATLKQLPAELDIALVELPAAIDAARDRPTGD